MARAEKTRQQIIVLAAGLLVPALPAVFADQADRIGQKVGDALRNVEAEKARAEHVMGAALAANLQQALQRWIDEATAAKSADVEKPVADQHWEQLPGAGSPVHYDYTLRGLQYTVDHYDVLKTESLLTPYKATAQIVETLHVSRYYPPNISDPAPFQHTVTTPVTVEFEYQDKRFVPVRVDRGSAAISKGWQ